MELSIKDVEEQKDKYQEYMEKLMQQWLGIANMESAKQQGEAMEDPIEIADGAEVFTEGPAIVEAAYVLTPTKSLPDFHN